MTDRKVEIAVALMKMGYSIRQTIKEMKMNMNLTEEDVKEIKSIGRGAGIQY